MTGFEKLENYTLLQQEEQHALFTSYRAGEIEGGRLTQHVRLDIVNPNLSANAGFIDQVMSQSLTTAKLEHTNITKKLTAVQQGTTLASVYEYLEGFSLQNVLDRSRSEGFPFSIDHALLVANKLANALAYAKSKNVHHGLVHPSFVFITNEGEIKLKGFALSSALKNVIASNPQVEGFLNPYLPDPRHSGGGGPERLDIFATGIILFEMITGQSFYADGRDIDAANRIQCTDTASDMEPIPESIRSILSAAIDPGADKTYVDVQSMAREIESLIFSGEYSPTTFNLAFFMHSAFRTDIEAINAQIKSERETHFDGSVAQAPPVPTTDPGTGASYTGAGSYSASGVVSATSKAPAKSNTGLFIGIGVAAVAAIAVAVFLFLPKGTNASVDKFDEQRQQLLEERRLQQESDASEKEEIMRLQIEALRSQIEEKQRTERESEAEQVKSEISELDQKIETAKQRAALESQLKEQQRQLEELQRQTEVERQAIEAERAKLEAAAQAKADEPEPETKTVETTPPIQQPLPAETKDTSTDSQVATNKPSTANTNKPQEKKTESVPITTTVKKDVVPTQPDKVKTSVPTPPQEGDLVEIDDTVVQPVLQDTLKYLPVPTKAVKNGTVRKGEVKTFLVRALVDERGRVEDVEMVRNPMAKFEDDYDMPDKALKHASKLRFSPAEKLGVKVKVWTHVGIHFKAR